MLETNQLDPISIFSPTNHANQKQQTNTIPRDVEAVVELVEKLEDLRWRASRGSARFRTVCGGGNKKGHMSNINL